MLHGIEMERPRHPAPAVAEDGRETPVWRIPIYRLLSGVFLEEPGAAFLDGLRSPESLAALAGAGLAFDTDFLRPDAARLAEQVGQPMRRPVREAVAHPAAGPQSAPVRLRDDLTPGAGEGKPERRALDDPRERPCGLRAGRRRKL